VIGGIPIQGSQSLDDRDLALDQFDVVEPDLAVGRIRRPIVIGATQVETQHHVGRCFVVDPELVLHRGIRLVLDVGRHPEGLGVRLQPRAALEIVIREQITGARGVFRTQPVEQQRRASVHVVSALPNPARRDLVAEPIDRVGGDRDR